MRKRESRNNKTTRAAQRIDHVEDLDDKKPKVKPKGRSIGGPWVRVKRRR